MSNPSGSAAPKQELHYQPAVILKNPLQIAW
jgi:hypothetical protein